MRRALQPVQPKRAEVLRRARLALEVARRTKESAEPFDGSIEPILGDLYRQSIHWSLQALNDDGARENMATESSDPWGRVDTSVLKLAGDSEALERVKEAVQRFTFVEFALLMPEERALLVGGLQSVATALVNELEISKRAREALWLQRGLRVGLVFVLALVCVGVAAKVRADNERSRDIAVGKPWRTSSWYGGCHSPEQECADSPDFFFHTQEEKSPWIEFDLGAPQRFSAIRVDNRKDCCTERASPLVVEVSSDQKNWKTVARREGVFDSWLGKFAPTESRWVRLRLEQRAVFHLLRVRVLR